jgi:Trk K+ transport system NAD-binding subunit
MGGWRAVSVPPPITEGPVLLSGDDNVPTRVREELEGAGVEVVTICSRMDCSAAVAATAAGSRLVIGDAAGPEVWERAGLHGARAVGLLGADDLDNLSAALLVNEEQASALLVVRMFSTELASGMARVLGDRATVLSETEVAAPAFLQAALSGNTGQRVTIAEHVLEVAEVDADDPRLVVALCNADTPADVLPTRAHLDARVLGLIDPDALVLGRGGAIPPTVALHRRQKEQRRAARRPRYTRRQRAIQSLRSIPLRVLALLGAILAVGGVSTTVFAVSDHLDLLDSVYFTATTMATVGYGDINLSGAPDWLKLYDIGLMAVSAVLLASVLALITDMLVRTRIDRALGRFPRPDRDHVIVCGLGKAGSRILAGLRALDVPCVGVEQHEGAIGVALARTLEVPVVFADGRTPGTLASLHVDTARAVMAVTSDDLANLQCALTARELKPDVRVVLRIFDPHLAERLDRSVALDLTRSVSALAAPAFTAALLGRRAAEPLPISTVALRVLETEVGAGSEIVGATVQALHHERDLRVLALDGRWRPREDLVIEAGAAVSIVGTREACDDLVLRVARPEGARRQRTATAGVPDAAAPSPLRRYRGATLGDD